MTAQPQRPMAPGEGRSGGLKNVTHVIAVSSCKGGVHHAQLTYALQEIWRLPSVVQTVGWPLHTFLSNTLSACR